IRRSDVNRVEAAARSRVETPHAETQDARHTGHGKGSADHLTRVQRLPERPFIRMEETGSAIREESARELLLKDIAKVVRPITRGGADPQVYVERNVLGSPYLEILPDEVNRVEIGLDARDHVVREVGPSPRVDRDPHATPAARPRIRRARVRHLRQLLGSAG